MLSILVSTIESTQRVFELTHVDTEPNKAFLPLIPILLIVIILLWLFKKRSPKPKSVNIAILGPNEAGKTTFWDFLLGRPKSTTYRETEGRERVKFKTSNIVWDAIKESNIIYRREDNTVIYGHGEDINGNGDFMRGQWKGLIKNANVVLFIFNARKYLDVAEYQRDVNQRMQFVMKAIDELKNREFKRNVWLLGSHADKLNDRKKDWSKIIEIIKYKPYHEIASNNDCLNLTNRKELNSYFRKVFDGYGGK